MDDPDDVTSRTEASTNKTTTTKSIARDDLLKLPQEVRNVVAGGVAGMAAKSLVAPIDRIKILYQISSAHFRLTDVPRVAYNIVNTEGLSALWKGNTATMIRIFPYAGIQFMVFDRVKSYMLHQHQQHSPVGREWGLSPMESLLAGCAAGTVSVLVTYPLDLTRAQLAVLKKKGHHQDLGIAQVIHGNYKQRGGMGLFRGITPTLLGILPYSGVAYSINEQAKRYIQNHNERAPTTFEKMECGALSGLFAQTLTYPLEVTRRRMQTIGIVPTHGKDAAVDALGIKQQSPGSGTHAPIVADRPVNMVTTMRLLYQEQGIRGFFKGVSMNWMKGPISFSISFTTFDIVQSLLATEEEHALRNPYRKG